MINALRLSVRFLLLLTLVFGIAPASAHADTVTYTTDDSIILNPERGLAKLITVGPSSIGDIEGLRSDNHTIAWGLIRLGDYTNNPVLPSEKIAEVTNWLEAVRANKLKAVLRVVYHDVQTFTPPSASIAVQQAHLRQLGASALKPHQDVILALQAGGIGAFGEWFYAPPELITSEPRKELLDTMFEASADNAFVMVRTPYYKQEYAAAGADPSQLFRTGHYNDCFLSNANDTGTYACYPASDSCPSVSALENTVASDSSVVPVGGETCNSTALNNCAATVAAMERFGYSFVNTLWFSSIRAKWETQGCFDEITKNLGYRFELVEADIPDSITAGREFQISVTVRNVGWAKLYKERPVYIRMTDENDAELVFYFTGAEARNWLADGQSYTFDASFTAPATLNTGSVSLSLWMPDNDPSNYRTPEYSIQMANADVWDPVAGDNVLAVGLPVTNAVALSCGQSLSIPSDQWALLSLPCNAPGGTTVEQLFSDDIRIGAAAATYGSDWVIYTYDSAIGDYVNPGANGVIQSGQGFWFIQRSGSSVTLDLPTGSVPLSAQLPISQACNSPNGCLDLPLSGIAGQWNLFGNPGPAQMQSAQLGLSVTSGICSSDNNGCNLSDAAQANIVSEEVRGYQNGAYVRFNQQPTIGAWNGFWLQELSGAAGNSPVLHLPLSNTN